jgi:hypothetical protein
MPRKEMILTEVKKNNFGDFNIKNSPFPHGPTPSSRVEKQF